MFHRLRQNWPTPSDLPADIAARLRVEQVNRLSSFKLVMAAIGLNTVVLLFVAFWNRRSLATDVPFACLPFCYGGAIWLGWKWQRKRSPLDRATDSARFLRFYLALVVGLGLFWGVLLAALSAVSGPEQRSLVYPTAIGAISTAAAFTPISVALGFLLPVTIGSFAALVISGNLLALITSGCLLGYAALILFSIFYFNKNFADRLLHEIKLEEQTEIIRLALRDFEESASDWLWETNDRLALHPVSARFAEVARSSVQAMHGASLHAVLFGPGLEPSEAQGVMLIRHLSDHSSFCNLVLPVTVEGEQRWWSLSGKPIHGPDGHFAGYRGVGSDVTTTTRAEQRLLQLASHDSLTGLANRFRFNKALQDLCATPGRHAAVLCLDLDAFKTVNDTLGHGIGDTLLVAVADRLRGCVRGNDLAARLGGDEFAVLLQADSPVDVLRFARRIIECLGQPYMLEGHTVQIGASIGIARAPEDGTAPDMLVRKADAALYRAKAEGRGRWQFFDPGADGRPQAKVVLLANARRPSPG